MQVGLILMALQAQAVRAQAPPAQWVEHLGLNVTVAPLDNVTLRQAIASAIDRQAVFAAAKGLFPAGRGIKATGPAGSWYPPNLPQHGPDVRIHPYDPAAASSLLAKAGFSEGSGLPEFEILYRQDLPARPVEADVLKTQLAAIGVKAKAVGLPTYRAFFDKVIPGPGRVGQYQMAIFAWGEPRPVQGKDDFLSGAFLQGGPQNGYGYRNPEVTLLIAAIVKETDSAKRLAMLREAEKLVLTDAPVVPLLYYYSPP
jgi:ABC-type transport system substrate-binding protein